MNTAEARTKSKYDHGMCKRCGGDIYLGDPIFLWDEVWVCGRCNVVLTAVDAGADWVEALFGEVPEAYREKVFRALATAFHPDHGADDAVMKRLLDLRERW
jgi:hypothetical protein